MEKLTLSLFTKKIPFVSSLPFSWGIFYPWHLKTDRSDLKNRDPVTRSVWKCLNSARHLNRNIPVRPGRSDRQPGPGTGTRLKNLSFLVLTCAGQQTAKAEKKLKVAVRRRGKWKWKERSDLREDEDRAWREWALRPENGLSVKKWGRMKMEWDMVKMKKEEEEEEENEGGSDGGWM